MPATPPGSAHSRSGKTCRCLLDQIGAPTFLSGYVKPKPPFSRLAAILLARTVGSLSVDSADAISTRQPEDTLAKHGHRRRGAGEATGKVDLFKMKDRTNFLSEPEPLDDSSPPWQSSRMETCRPPARHGLNRGRKPGSSSSRHALRRMTGPSRKPFHFRDGSRSPQGLP